MGVLRRNALDTIAVIDFETTGLSPDCGDRATEIAAVLVRDGQIVDRYQSLMNAGVRIPAFITSLTGISTAMVRQAPPSAQVMAEVAEFVGELPLVAHNAAFDYKFWDAELARIGRQRRQAFACSMLVARRVLPQAPNHQGLNLSKLRYGIPYFTLKMPNIFRIFSRDSDFGHRMGRAAIW